MKSAIVQMRARRDQVADMKSGVLSALGVLLLVAGFAPAQAEWLGKPVCKIIRTADAALLQQCDRQLRSFALSMPGTERTAAREQPHKFKFTCRPGFCLDEPDVSGWFVNPEAWKRGKQDEPAIFDLYADLAGWKLLRSEQHSGLLQTELQAVRSDARGIAGANDLLRNEIGGCRLIDGRNGRRRR